MSSYSEKTVSLRRREDVEAAMMETAAEEGEYSSEDVSEEERSSRRKSRKHSHKKHKSSTSSGSKKEKKKKKRRHRSPSGSPSRKRSRRGSPQEDETDAEEDNRASTPEIIDVDAIEDGEIGKASPKATKSSGRRKTEEEEKQQQRHSRDRASRRRHRDSPPSKRSPSPSQDKESLSIQETNQLREKLGLKPLNINDEKNPEKPPSKGSLTIEETNRLRAEIGLKPLKEIEKSAPAAAEDDNTPSEFSQFEVIPSSLKNERHRPPQNLREVSRTEKIRRRLQERREKRQQEAKLLLVKGLGEPDDEEDASVWIKKQERLSKDKEAAAKRAKMLDELDDEFGVGALVKEENGSQDANKYGQKDLQGLKVEHSLDRFSEGQSVILTLKDADVLDESEGDALVNVNMVDDERAKKKIEDSKKAKTGYNPYDQEMVDQETGELIRKNLLDKYDEEIDGEVKKSFAIGSEGLLSKDKEKERIREKLNKNLVSLELPEKKIASDYYTPSEVVAFKKTKKKKKMKRRMLKADDLINMMNSEPMESFGSRAPKEIEDQDTGEIKDLSQVDVCQEEKKTELSQAEKLRMKIREKLKKKSKPDLGDLLLQDAPVRDEVHTSSGAELIGTFADDEINSKNIILNETSEFCRNLGAWTSNYGSTESKESVSVLEEFEDSLKSNSTKSREERWKEMDMSCGEDDNDTEGEESQEKKKVVESVTILDEEPNLNVGVGSAIKMAVNKGYWESDVQKKSGSNLNYLMSQNYFIEDKVVRDDDRSSRRQDRYGGGPTVAFQEKKDYSPKINLEYIDDSGRKLNSKEAFRYLSHRFHGKGSGKLKTEKRMKKSVEESMMRNMSSTDTPLGTVEKMLKKQKETSTPYLVISGKNQHPELRK